MISTQNYRYQTHQLDNLEMLYVSGCSEGFPLHFHETYCLSLILEGTEQIELANRSLLALPGSLSITHPREAHANPVAAHSRQAFATLYISEDVMRYLNGGELARFALPVIQDPALFAVFAQLVRPLSAQQTKLHFLTVDEVWFLNLLRYLIQRHATAASAQHTPRKDWFASLDELMDEQLHRKLSLDEMAQQMGLSKFKFARLFKATRGISPAHYLLVKRIERAKTLLRQGCPLADTPFQVGFYDQAHFSRAFRRVTGVTPGSYREATKK